MSDAPTAAYRRLPVRCRSAAATLQGARLRWWRYGRASEPLVAEALARDAWDEDRWRSWQQARLRLILDRAATTVPWYQRRLPSAAPPLDGWPVLAKSELRRDPSALLALGAPRRRYRDRTSGTTGTPITTWAGRASLQRWFALHEARTRRWHGVSRHDRWALLGGQAVVPGDRDRPPYWVHNRAGAQLYLSGQHVSPTTAGAYAEAIVAHAPTHLVAYPTMAAALARALVAARVDPPGPPLVVANAEAVTAGQRRAIEEGLGGTVRETYGMAEMVGGASECERGRLHWWPDAGVLEVLDDEDQPVAPGEVGRLVLTGLVNEEQLLVRYDVGDRGRGGGGGGCPCGRGLPQLAPVEGRVQDVVVLPDGREVFWLNPLFYDLAVVQAQVRQEAEADVRILVVGAEGWGDDDRRRLLDRAADRLGADVRIEVESVSAIPADPSGKVRPVVNLVRPAR